MLIEGEHFQSIFYKFGIDIGNPVIKDALLSLFWYLAQLVPLLPGLSKKRKGLGDIL